MLFRLVRPMFREGSTRAHFRQRIPRDVLQQARGMTLDVPCGEATKRVVIRPLATHIRFSLGSRDPGEVKARHAQAAAYVDALWNALREDAPVPLTHRQAVALSGKLYRAWVNGEGRERVTAVVHDPETGEWVRDHEPAHEAERTGEWDAAVGAVNGMGDEPGELEGPLGAIVDRLLLSEGIKRVDTPSRAIILTEFKRALSDAFALRRRHAEGEYSPDPKSERFPEWSRGAGNAAHKTPRGKHTLTGLFEAWRKEAEATGRASYSTVKNYGGTVKLLVAFLKHDDARRVAPGDVVAFKDHRLDGGLSPKTVKDVDLVALKAIFSWAVANHHLPSNPAAGITLKLGKDPRTRPKGFTDAEALAVLAHALGHTGSRREAPKTTAAKRWVPWLCAYTGARVGEIVQLRKADVRRDGKHWIITITPEAGTVKTGEVRQVPVHPHLVELGFTEFVAGAPDGYLFFTPSKGGWRGPHGSLCKKLAAFVREVVPDKRVAPNHGWRHHFKTRGLEAGIQERVLDALCGHAPRTAGEGYGEVSLKARTAAIDKLPRFVM